MDSATRQPPQEHRDSLLLLALAAHAQHTSALAASTSIPYATTSSTSIKPCAHPALLPLTPLISVSMSTTTTTHHTADMLPTSMFIPIDSQIPPLVYSDEDQYPRKRPRLILPSNHITCNASKLTHQVYTHSLRTITPRSSPVRSINGPVSSLCSDQEELHEVISSSTTISPRRQQTSNSMIMSPSSLLSLSSASSLLSLSSSTPSPSQSSFSMDHNTTPTTITEITSQGCALTTDCHTNHYREEWDSNAVGAVHDAARFLAAQARTSPISFPVSYQSSRYEEEKEDEEEEKNQRNEEEEIEDEQNENYSSTATTATMTTRRINRRQDKGRFACASCPKVFTRACNLKSHTKTHTQERPYVCSHCRQGFARKQDCIRHGRIHTNERPFACGKCGMRFSRQDAVSRHAFTCKLSTVELVNDDDNDEEEEEEDTSEC